MTNLVDRLERSVWCAVLLKVGGVGLALLLLAGVGAYSTLAGLRGVPIPLEGPEKKDVASAWLAAAPARAAPPSAPPPANPSAPAAKAAEKTECGKAGGCDGDARKPDGDPAKKDRGVTADGKVILNLATADELTRLPGVGKKRAEAIVELRTRLKRFRRVTDLLRVRGIGVKSLRRITPLVVLDPPSESSPAPDAGAEPAPPERVPSPS